MSILRNKLFLSVGFSHLIIDVLNGQRGVLLAFLSVPLALSNRDIGLVSIIYLFAAALIQPISGWLADRVGPRWLVAGGVLWMGSFFALALIIPGRIALAFLVLASLGSGMFHPAGSMESTLIGRTHLSGREGTASAMFFFFGQSGNAIGPLLGGPLLDAWGLSGLLLPLIVCLPISAYGGWQLRKAIKSSESLPGEVPNSRNDWKKALQGKGWLVVVLLLVATSQSWVSQNMQTFVPKYLSDLGQTATVYGFLTSLYMFGSAGGNIFGGFIGDHFGQRAAIISGLALLGIPIMLIPIAGSAWLYLILPVAGIFNGFAYTAIFTTSQRILPGATGLMAGLAMSFMFSIGSVGALVSGAIADTAGFPPVFYITAAIAILGSLSAIGLRSDRPTGVVVRSLEQG